MKNSRLPGGVAKVLAAIAVIAVIAGIATGVYFDKVMVVKTVTVNGVDAETEQEIKRIGGVRLGQSIFDVDERQVEISLRENGYIKLCDVEVIMPDKVVITAERREKMAVVEHLGFQYIVDRELSVLECLSGTSDAGVMRITGAGIQQTPVGMTMNMDESRRKLATDVLSAIADAGLNDVVSELNVANLQSIYIVTRSRYVFRLGDGTRLADKLGWVLPMQEQLQREGRQSGTVDISNVNAADYIPPQATPTPEVVISPLVTFAPFDLPQAQ